MFITCNYASIKSDYKEKMELNILTANPESKKWLYDLHKRSLGPYVKRLYGWEEAVQIKMFEEWFNPKRCHLILLKDEKIGMISYIEKPENIQIFRIELEPEYQRKGIGTEVLNRMINSAKTKSKDVVLRVYKINPAKRLYDRLGFQVTSENETHYYMKWSFSNKI